MRQMTDEQIKARNTETPISKAELRKLRHGDIITVQWTDAKPSLAMYIAKGGGDTVVVIHDRPLKATMPLRNVHDSITTDQIIEVHHNAFKF